MNTDPTDNRHENSTELLTPGRRVALGAALGALVVTGAAHFSIDTAPKPAPVAETDSTTVSLYETAAKQAAEHGSSLAEGDIPAALDTALRDYQKMWDHGTEPTAESASVLDELGATNFTIQAGDRLIDNATVAYQQLHPEVTDVAEIPPSVKNSITVTSNSYEEGLGGGSMQPGTELTLFEVTDPTDPEHTTWAVVTDRVVEDKN